MNTATRLTTATTIVRPVIKAADFTRIMQRYDTYAAQYNEEIKQLRASGDRSAQTLKSAHRALFMDLVSQARAQMVRVNSQFKDAPQYTELDLEAGYTVNTNNKRFTARTGKNAATVWRNTERLIDAGIITSKTLHGHVRNYELNIAGPFLSVSALDNSQNGVVVDFPNTFLLCSNIAKCNVEHNTKTLNNIIIGRENLLKTEQQTQTELPINNTDNEQSGAISANAANNSNACVSIFTKNDTNKRGGKSAKIGELINIPPIEKAAPKEISPAEKQAKQAAKIATMQQAYANWLVEYMLIRLFANHNEYQSTIGRAKNLALAYFSTARNIPQCEKLKRIYTWRVDAAAAWVERTGFNMKNIHISNYVDVNNTTSGFTRTKVWAEKSAQYRAYREKLAILKSPMNKLIDTVAKLNNKMRNHTFKLQDYMVAEAYVQNNLPETYYSQFLDLTAYIRNGQKCPHTF